MSAGFPTIAEVECADVESVLRWNRTLPLPKDHRDVELLKVLVARLADLRASDPVAYVRASKSIGWSTSTSVHQPDSNPVVK